MTSNNHNNIANNVTSNVSSNVAKCSCGKTQLSMQNKPIMRVICHCTICQEFNNAPFADIVIFNKKDVSLAKESQVNFKAYTSPPLVQRGKCSACNKPAIEFLNIPVMPALTIVPTAIIENKTLIPEPSFHSFYHRRVADAQDNLPKYNSFLSSQAMFMVKLLTKKLGI